MFVFSNLATSVDGKIATASREHFPLGTPYDRKLMQVLRRRCDAVLFGATTLRAFRKPCTARGATKQPMNVVISSALEGISPAWPFFKAPGFRRILFVSCELPAARRRAFERTSEIVFLKGRGPVAAQVIRELSRRGVERLLVEGGGSTMWDFASHDLIDEYYVTLTPRILGGTEAPTLVDGAGFAPRQVVNLRLARARRIGDELYLVYRKTGRRGP